MLWASCPLLFLPYSAIMHILQRYDYSHKHNTYDETIRSYREKGYRCLMWHQLYPGARARLQIHPTKMCEDMGLNGSTSPKRQITRSDKAFIVDQHIEHDGIQRTLY